MDKRTDCLLTLALDASGFVHRSQVFAGNVRESYFGDAADARSGEFLDGVAHTIMRVADYPTGNRSCS